MLLPKVDGAGAPQKQGWEEMTLTLPWGRKQRRGAICASGCWWHGWRQRSRVLQQRMGDKASGETADVLFPLSSEVGSCRHARC